MKTFTKSLLAVASMAAIAPAIAASANTNVNVSATVNNTCTFTATSNDINFGVLNMPSMGTASASGELKVACTKELPYAIEVGGASQTPSEFHELTHTDGATKLTYGLYTDAGFTTPANSATPAFTGTGTGVEISHPLYARINLNQPALAGSYSNTHVVTVTY